MTRSMRIRPESFYFTLFLAALGAIVPLSIDLGLPAIPTISRSLGSSSATAALTLSVFMAGYALAPIVLGPLSDRYGRRPVLLSSLALFTVAGVTCAAAPSMSILLASRVIQGAGAGAGAVLVLAIVRDSFEGRLARSRLAYVRVIQTVAPMIAPTLGAWVLAAGGWRAIYGTLAGAGLVLFALVAFGFTESARLRGGPSLAPRVLWSNYRQVLGNKVSLGYILINAFTFGALFAYVSGSPLVMLELLHVSPRVYGLLFATTASGITAGAFLSGRLNARGVAPSRLLTGGLVLAATASVLLLVIAASGMARVSTLLPPLVLCTFSAGLIGPNAAHGAMDPLPEIAGAAAAVLSFLQMVCGSVSGMLVASLYDGRTALSMTGMMLVFSLAALSVYAGILRRLPPTAA